MRRFGLWLAAAATAGGLFTSPALAQVAVGSAGLWWSSQTDQAPAFRFIRPQMYGRVGGLFGWQQNAPVYVVDSSSAPISLGVNDGYGIVVGIGARLMPVLRTELQLIHMFSRGAILGFDTAGGSFRYRADVRSIQFMNN